MEFAELLKAYGPWALGWVGFAYVGRFVMSRYDTDISSRVTLANAIDKLTTEIKERRVG